MDAALTDVARCNCHSTTALASLATLVQGWERDGAWPPPPPAPATVDIGLRGSAAAYIVAVARVYAAPCSPALAPLIQPLPVLFLRSSDVASDAVIGACLAEYIASADEAGKIPDAAALEEALLTNQRWRLLAQHASMWPCHLLGPALYFGSSLPATAVDLLLPALQPSRCLRLASLSSLYLSSSPSLQLLLLRAPPSHLRPATSLRCRLVWLAARARFEAETSKTVAMDDVSMWEKLIKHVWNPTTTSTESSSAPLWTLANPYFVRILPTSQKPSEAKWERLGPLPSLWASWEAAAPAMPSLYYSRFSAALATTTDEPYAITVAILSALARQTSPAPGASTLAEWVATSATSGLLSLLPSAAPSLSTAQQLLHWLPPYALFPASTEEQAASSLVALTKLWEVAPHWAAPSLRSYWVRLLSSVAPPAMPLFHSAAATSSFLLSLLPALEASTKMDASINIIAAVANKRMQPPSSLATVNPLAASPIASAVLRSSPASRGDWEKEVTSAAPWPVRRTTAAANASVSSATSSTTLPAAPPLLFSLPGGPAAAQSSAASTVTTAPPPFTLPPASPVSASTPSRVLPVKPLSPHRPRSRATQSLLHSSPAPSPSPAAQPPTPPAQSSPLSALAPVSQAPMLFSQSVVPAVPSPSRPTPARTPLLRTSPAASASSPPAPSARRALPLAPLKRLRPASDEAEETEEAQDDVLLL